MSGVLLNVITIVVGTAIGLLFGRAIHERFRSIAFAGIGLSTTVIGASMAISGLAKMGESRLGEYAPLVFIGSLVVGSLTGEALRIEHALERFGCLLKDIGAKFTPSSSADAATTEDSDEQAHTLVEGFVTASLLFCVGAMAVLGSLQDGLGDHQLLYIKSTLDGVAALFLASTLGIGVGLSIIPVALYQGGLALGAHALSPYMTESVISATTAVGGALILAIGIDLLGIKRLPVGNMLPAIVFAVVVAGIVG